MTRLKSAPWFWILLAGTGVAGLILANVHLVFVAVSSQPDCVPHDRIADAATIPMRAAKSSC